MPTPERHTSCGRDLMSLPDELHVRIMLELDFEGLVACYRVCRKLRNSMEDSPRIRYRLALSKEGLQDNPHSARPLYERAQMLTKYQANHSERPPCYSFDQACHYVFPYITGGVIVYVASFKMLEAYRPACVLTGIPEKTWRISLENTVEGWVEDDDWESVGSVAVNTDRDLFAFTTVVHRVPRLYLISLSLDTMHSAAAQNPIHDAGDTPHGTGADDAIEVMDDLIGWSIQVSHVYVYNWTTGQLLWYNQLSEEADFRMYMGVHVVDSLHAIKVVDTEISIVKLSGGTYQSETGSEDVCQLQLPFLAEGVSVEDVQSYYARPPINSDAPFSYDPDLTVFTLYLEVIGDDLPFAILVIIPVSTIYATIERIRYCTSSLRSPSSPMLVPWDDWGSDGARLVLLPARSLGRFENISALGSRVALTVSLWELDTDENQCEVAIFDVRRGLDGLGRQESSDVGALGPSDLVWVSDCYAPVDTRIFRDPVHTRMPYRVSRGKFSARELSRADLGINVGLIHDGIVNLWEPED